MIRRLLRFHRHVPAEHEFFAFGIRRSRCRCGHTWPPVWPDA